MAVEGKLHDAALVIGQFEGPQILWGRRRYIVAAKSVVIGPAVGDNIKHVFVNTRLGRVVIHSGETTEQHRILAAVIDGRAEYGPISNQVIDDEGLHFRPPGTVVFITKGKDVHKF